MDDLLEKGTEEVLCKESSPVGSVVEGSGVGEEDLGSRAKGTQLTPGKSSRYGQGKEEVSSCHVCGAGSIEGQVRRSVGGGANREVQDGGNGRRK